MIFINSRHFKNEDELNAALENLPPTPVHPAEHITTVKINSQTNERHDIELINSQNKQTSYLDAGQAHNYNRKLPARFPSLPKHNYHTPKPSHYDSSYLNDEPYFKETYITGEFTSPYPLIGSQVSRISPLYQPSPTPKWDSQKLPVLSTPTPLPYGYKIGSNIKAIPSAKPSTYSYTTKPNYQPVNPVNIYNDFKIQKVSPYGQKVYSHTGYDLTSHQIRLHGRRQYTSTQKPPSHINDEPYFDSSIEQTNIDAIKNSINRVIFYEDTKNKIDGSKKKHEDNSSESSSSSEEHETSGEEETQNHHDGDKPDLTSDDEDGFIDRNEWQQLTTLSSPTEITTLEDITETVTESITEEPVTNPIIEDSTNWDLINDADEGTLTTANDVITTNSPFNLSEINSARNEALDFFFEGNNSNVDSTLNLETVTFDPLLDQTISPQNSETLNFEADVASNMTSLMNMLKSLGLSKSTEEKIMKMTSKQSLSDQLRLMAKLADFLADQNSQSLESILRQTDNEIFDPSGEVMMIIPTNGSKQFVALTVFAGEDITNGGNNSQVQPQTTN